MSTDHFVTDQAFEIVKQSDLCNHHGRKSQFHLLEVYLDHVCGMSIVVLHHKLAVSVVDNTHKLGNLSGIGYHHSVVLHK